MKNNFLYFFIFVVIFFPTLIYSADEKEIYQETENIVNELLEGKNWKENRRAAKEAFQKDQQERSAAFA